MKSFATEKKKQLDDIAVSGTRRHSRAADIWLRLVRDKSAVVSLVLLGIIILLAIFADVLFDKSNNPEHRASQLSSFVGALVWNGSLRP